MELATKALKKLMYMWFRQQADFLGKKQPTVKKTYLLLPFSMLYYDLWAEYPCEYWDSTFHLEHQAHFIDLYPSQTL